MLVLLCALATAGSAAGFAAGTDETTVMEALVLIGQGHQADAARILEPVAAGGSASAQYQLGLLLARGEGVTQDFARAADCFARAAEQDHSHAQFILGHMYSRGEGLARDPVQAYVWFSAATANGWWKAREARERLVAAGMSAQQVALAGKRYRDWRARRDAAGEEH